MNPITQFLGARRLRKVRPPVPTVARIAVTTRPIFGPWGGGNQWLLQFSRYMHYAGYEVVHDLAGGADCVLIQHNGLTGLLVSRNFALKTPPDEMRAPSRHARKSNAPSAGDVTA